MRFHLAIEDLDLEQVMTFYVNPGTRVDWGGQAGVFGGTYPAWANVRLLWASVMGLTQDVQITLSHYQAFIVGDEAQVTYIIIINTGRGDLVGDFRMVISANTTWSLVDGNWMIVEQSWDFILFEAEIVAQGTVFRYIGIREETSAFGTEEYLDSGGICILEYGCLLLVKVQLGILRSSGK